MEKFFKKGIVSYLTVVVISVLLAMVVGIIPILITQTKTISGKEDSTIAFYAADTGAERVLEAIDVGYDLYQYPFSYGQCKNIEGKQGCDFSACQPLISFNSGDCGLPSRCQKDNDCFCPTDKCIGFNYYDYPLQGYCRSNQCFNCSPVVSANDKKCGYDSTNPPQCSKNEDCSCPENQCIGLDLNATPSFPWETPYFDNFANGASYKTYIDKVSGKFLIKSVGTYQETKRAVEFSR